MNHVKLSREYMYDIIHTPIITEKTNAISNHSQVAFYVSLTSSKAEIKVAVEGIFGVQVKSVNTLIHKGKIKRFRGRRGRESDIKKAIVTLAKGDFIDVTTGI